MLTGNNTLHFDGYAEPCIVQGTTFEKTIIAKDNINGVESIKNLTGYTATMKIKRNYGAELIYELNTTNGRILLGGALGTVVLNIPVGITNTLPNGRFIYELILTDPTTKSYLFLKGQFTIQKKV